MPHRQPRAHSSASISSFFCRRYVAGRLLTMLNAGGAARQGNPCGLDGSEEVAAMLNRSSSSPLAGGFAGDSSWRASSSMDVPAGRPLSAQTDSWDSALLKPLIEELSAIRSD